MIDVPALLKALRIDAQRRGREWWAACPLPGHDESEPSWSIADSPGSDRHGYHYCFGCGRGGSGVSLVCEVIDITWSSAMRWVAEQGLDVDAPAPLSVSLVVKPGMARNRFQLPLGCHGGPLPSWPTPIRRYVERRGITSAQVDRWNLMYSTEGRLEGRVVFPYAANDGSLTGYTARSWDGREPRYKEPHYAEGADSNAMLGPVNWPEHGEDRDVVVVAEGAINALALERAGARYIAAPGGSKTLTSSQMALLASFDVVVVASDNDQAGDSMAEALVGGLSRWSKVRRIAFPKGVDAAQMPSDELAGRLRGAVGNATRHGNRETVPH